MAMQPQLPSCELILHGKPIHPIHGIHVSGPAQSPRLTRCNHAPAPSQQWRPGLIPVMQSPSYSQVSGLLVSLWSSACGCNLSDVCKHVCLCVLQVALGVGYIDAQPQERVRPLRKQVIVVVTATWQVGLGRDRHHAWHWHGVGKASPA